MGGLVWTRGCVGGVWLRGEEGKGTAQPEDSQGGRRYSCTCAGAHHVWSWEPGQEGPGRLLGAVLGPSPPPTPG